MPVPHALTLPVGHDVLARSRRCGRARLGLGWEQYPTEPLPYDGSVLHALERLFPLVTEQRGMRVVLTNVSGVSR